MYIKKGYPKNRRRTLASRLINKGRKQTAEAIENNKKSRKAHFDLIGRKPKNGKRLKTRFDIFCRDNFTCYYCGRKPPEVILEIDHKFPKSKDGKNRMENYITSCRDCNIGKGDSILKEFIS